MKKKAFHTNTFPSELGAPIRWLGWKWWTDDWQLSSNWDPYSGTKLYRVTRSRRTNPDYTS